jgi:hypothetical protein
MFKLFLDDLMDPKDVLNPSVSRSKIYRTDGWVTVRSYDAFKTVIQDCQIFPDLISFDHNLNKNHRQFEPALKEYSNKSVSWLRSEVYSKTYDCGWNCADWLIRFCVQSKINLPICLVHCIDDVLANNIIKLFDFYKYHIHCALRGFHETAPY